MAQRGLLHRNNASYKGQKHGLNRGVGVLGLPLALSYPVFVICSVTMRAILSKKTYNSVGEYNCQIL